MEKKKKKVVVDHYRVLGLPSGVEGTELEEKEITKAYRIKALKLHPDKRPNDPDAKAKFQRLNSSYAILRDPKARKQFDSSLRLENKPSSQPKTVASEPEQKASKQNNELFLYGFFIFVLAPMIFPAARSQNSMLARLICLIIGFDVFNAHKQSLYSKMVRVGNYFKRNPPPAATNQESQGDDHEDIEDWVIV